MTPEQKAALAGHLSWNNHWWEDRGQGCDTCGDGGGIEIDYEALVETIDAFTATFKN